MIVKALHVGTEVSGLQVGHRDIRRYFPRDINRIELQLDDLRIECGLPPNFSRTKLEIHDPRLCLWLQSKDRAEKPCRASVPFTMNPSGANSFKLDPVVPDGGHRGRHASVHDSDFGFEVL